MTATDLADQYAHGTMPAEAVEEMYRLRDAEVATLAAKPAIDVDDVRALERTGRCRVAGELFARCDDAARDALLQDLHHFVRSTAECSMRALHLAT